MDWISGGRSASVISSPDASTTMRSITFSNSRTLPGQRCAESEIATRGDMRNAAPEGVEISQVILAAPDVDADSFSNLAKAIQGLAKNVTLYVAGNDRALIVSRNFWGSYRAGDVPPAGPLILPGIER